MRDVKKALSIVIIVALTLLVLPALGSQKTYAATSQDVSATESIELEKYNLNVYPFDDDISEGQFGDVIKVTKGKAVDVKVLDESIAEAYIDSYYTWSEDYDGEVTEVNITSKNKLGKTSIVVYGEDGSSKTINMTVAIGFKMTPKTLKFDYTYDGYEEHLIGTNEWYGEGCDAYAKGYLKSVTSRNTNIAKIKTQYVGQSFYLIPCGVGTTTLDCVDKWGQKDTITVTVSKKFMNGYVKTYSSVKTIKSGDKATGKAPVGAKVVVRAKGKTYKTTVGSNKQYAIKLPQLKIGTSVVTTITYNGGTYKVTKKVTKPSVKVSSGTVYRSTKQVKVAATNLQKGDMIYLKAGKKTYSKKVKKTVKKATFTFKIKKQKAGSSLVVTVKNKYKQKITSKSIKVYYASKVKKGMTKKQCLLVPKWRSPEYKRKDGDMDVWYYDFGSGTYDAYLEFNGGKLVYVHYY